MFFRCLTPEEAANLEEKRAALAEWYAFMASQEPAGHRRDQCIAVAQCFGWEPRRSSSMTNLYAPRNDR